MHWPLRLFSLFACSVLVAGTNAGEPRTAVWDQARKLAGRAPDTASREELEHEIALALARSGAAENALALAAQLPPGPRAMVLLEVAAHLPASHRAGAEQLMLDAQTAKSMTRDWRKGRLARLLAVGHARLDHFAVAEALALAVPDTEEKAFALQEVVVELCRAGQIAQARQLAGTIEENRRYGTYRQKAIAFAATAEALQARGNPDDSATLLTQAELLLPKKPGWSDGVAFAAVAEAAHARGQMEKSRELLARARALAQTIAGSWKVSELARIAVAYNHCGEGGRAKECLDEGEKFHCTLAPFERAEEALPLARAWISLGQPEKGRSILRAIVSEIEHAENQAIWRKPHVRALLAWAELFGDEPIAEK